MKTIWLVIPCYNEEEVLPETAKRLLEIHQKLVNTNKITPQSKICMVNDGSKDKTWSIISKLHNENNIFSGINLSRNRGHQNALLAGLMTAKEYADAVISLDADLQDDINVIEKFVDCFNNGYDIVYGVRSSRKTDTFFKRFTAEGFYKVMKVLGVDVVFNHADYRLMSKRALEGLSEFKEVNLFLRGIVPQIGYPSTIVEYERHERFAGESKYPLKKMLSFAFDGITSFSVKPMKIIINIGIAVFFVSIIMLLYALISKILGFAVSGWTSLIGSIWMIGGIQLLSLGIVGEYVGKIYSESKQRPRYIIQELLNEEDV
ncbi:glycosyltransferase family 2 protein [Murimonas intestini]|uniref:Glycosyltransferase involved in cell wall biosynthesis n=1 Tax=Murimonas intestini TaxID=1337051 RepID=A0AB73T903_9FIRM|nr:glycosyltransferase family 2 protein [Murimonas intestini]MCR1839479.1 glycosyltransferase family 2 protein [Murimonas intestini]MCR1864774.1 glycosyltransferase family 2 protein [Murimonas intestini]MCR1882384.1 glycosyltransferase family 2 protein [Murimonas intestini]